MGTVVIQKGHWPRTRGATGTSSHRGSEQAFAYEVAHRIPALTHHTVHVIGADDRIPSCDVFVALHQDGASDRRARGASVGYPRGSVRSQVYGARWKALYQAAGYPFGFRGDNYTAALAGYYAFARTGAPVRVLVEHGFATNVADADWQWDRLDLIARVHADAIDLELGRAANPPVAPPSSSQEDDIVNLIYVQPWDHWYLAGPGGVQRIGDWGKVTFWRDVAKVRVVMFDPASFNLHCGPVMMAGVL
jgi:hypothetical protein